MFVFEKLKIWKKCKILFSFLLRNGKVELNTLNDTSSLVNCLSLSSVTTRRNSIWQILVKCKVLCVGRRNRASRNRWKLAVGRWQKRAPCDCCKRKTISLKTMVLSQIKRLVNQRNSHVADSDLDGSSSDRRVCETKTWTNQTNSCFVSFLF